jgi:hypothetical protein
MCSGETLTNQIKAAHLRVVYAAFDKAVLSCIFILHCLSLTISASIALINYNKCSSDRFVCCSYIMCLVFVACNKNDSTSPVLISRI